MIFTQIKLTINDQEIKVLNANDCIDLRHFNAFPTTSRLVFIRQSQIGVVAALNASDISILIDSWQLDLDLDV